MISRLPALFLFLTLGQLCPAQPIADSTIAAAHGATAEVSEDSLGAARASLEQAFASYREGDIDATRQFLRRARELLDRSEAASETDSVRAEVRKLVAEMESFEQKLAQGDDKQENNIARFWRRATSFIRREAEQLVHQYVELSQNEKTFKHLLDAKMHLFIAEHDLFISHDTQDAYAELEQVLADLDRARQEAIPEVEPRVQNLIAAVTTLQQAMREGSQLWLDNEVLRHLVKAQSEMALAENTAMPEISLQISVIRLQISDLRKRVETLNLRSDYDAIMDSLKLLIAKLESE